MRETTDSEKLVALVDRLSPIVMRLTNIWYEKALPWFKNIRLAMIVPRNKEQEDFLKNFADIRPKMHELHIAYLSATAKLINPELF